MTLTIVALIIPSLFSHSIGQAGDIKVEALSLGVSVIMIVLYGLDLLYSLKVSKGPVTHVQEDEHKQPEWSRKQALLILALSTADGESNWLEGAALLEVYLILGIAFFLLPTESI